MTPAERGELVAMLMGVPGVTTAQVEPDGDGPGTLRLELAPDADEVGVAGEVNSLLRDRFGLAVDPARVRVLAGGIQAGVVDDTSADVRPQPPSLVPATSLPQTSVPTAFVPGTAEAGEAQQPTHAGRVSIDRVRLSSSGLVTTVSVTLSMQGRQVEGTSQGTATAESLNRAVATATLRAVEGVADGAVRFELEHVEIARTPGEETALAIVTMVTERSTQRLSGASVVREDLRQAVIRAVLAAVNRQIAIVLGGGERPT